MDQAQGHCGVCCWKSEVTAWNQQKTVIRGWGVAPRIQTVLGHTERNKFSGFHTKETLEEVINEIVLWTLLCSAMTGSASLRRALTVISIAAAHSFSKYLFKVNCLSTTVLNSEDT